MSGMCYLEVISQKGEICWEPIMGHHEEKLDGMEKYIWSWGVGNRGHNL